MSPYMLLITLYRTPGFTHLTLSISDWGLPSHPAIWSHRSLQHSSTLGTILRLKESPQVGPVPLQGLPRATHLMPDSERADVMWNISPRPTSIFSLLWKNLLTFLKISLWERIVTWRRHSHKWVDCPDIPWESDLISKYICPFTPQHKGIRLNCSILSSFFFFLV